MLKNNEALSRLFGIEAPAFGPCLPSPTLRYFPSQYVSGVRPLLAGILVLSFIPSFTKRCIHDQTLPSYFPLCSSSPRKAGNHARPVPSYPALFCSHRILHLKKSTCGRRSFNEALVILPPCTSVFNFRVHSVIAL
jgi:hypothetical protein